MPLPYQGGLPSYGKAHSTFGHVSVEVNGESFSFGPNGMDTSATCTARQRELRDAIAHRLNLSPEQEGKVQSCLSRSRGGGGYSSVSNNCAAPIQNCLHELGPVLSPLNAVFPETLNMMLYVSPIAESSKNLKRRGP